jgi:hypothetical protein
VVFLVVGLYSRLCSFYSFSLPSLPMSLRRPFVAPRSTRANRPVSQAKQDKLEISPLTTGKGNEEEGYNQTPISEWRVGDDEEDLIPVSQLLVKEKVIVNPYPKGIKRMSEREADECARHGEVLRWSTDDEEDKEPELFLKGHVNLGKIVAKFFDTVLFVGTVTEVIPRRRDFLYKVTYEDGDQEDMDEAELLYVLELKHKKDKDEDLRQEAEGDNEFSGLSEEGSEYDSEEDKRDARKNKKRKAAEDKATKASRIQKFKKTKWTVRPEHVAHIGGVESMLGKSMARCQLHIHFTFHIIKIIHYLG